MKGLTLNPSPKERDLNKVSPFGGDLEGAYRHIGS